MNREQTERITKVMGVFASAGAGACFLLFILAVIGKLIGRLSS